MFKKKKTLMYAINRTFEDVWKAIRSLYKDVNDTQGDIPATVGLERLGVDRWHFTVKTIEGEQHCSVKGNLSMILHMGVCFKKIYDWDEKKEEKKDTFIWKKWKKRQK